MVFVTDANAVPTVGTNSYITVEEAVGYATNHLYPNFTGLTNKAPYVFRAMDFIESYRDQFKGSKTIATQPLQWPRAGVTIDDIQLEENIIPDEVKEAVAICAIEMADGYDPQRPLRPRDDAQTSDSVSLLSSNVSERYLVSWGLEDVLPHVEALLRPLLRDDVDDIVVRI